MATVTLVAVTLFENVAAPVILAVPVTSNLNAPGACPIPIFVPSSQICAFANVVESSQRAILEPVPDPLA